MKHSTALSERGTDLAPYQDHDNPNCSTQLIYLYDGFWSDVSWSVYYCPTCDQIICVVGGGVHHWNYTSVAPRAENLERGRALAQELERESHDQLAEDIQAHKDEQLRGLQ